MKSCMLLMDPSDVLTFFEIASKALNTTSLRKLMALHLDITDEELARLRKIINQYLEPQE